MRMDASSSGALALGALLLMSCGSGGQSARGGTGGNPDVTPPTTGQVMDGLGADTDHQSETDSLSANWTGFSDAQSGISRYQWAIGTTPGGVDVMKWTNAGNELSATMYGLDLECLRTYYIDVRVGVRAGI